MQKPYTGPAVDLFASAVILFSMVAQHLPFVKAHPKDPFYKVIGAKKYDLFWDTMGKNKSSDFFSGDFKDLFINMV